jgi:hypothetical protein
LEYQIRQRRSLTSTHVVWCRSSRDRTVAAWDVRSGTRLAGLVSKMGGVTAAVLGVDQVQVVSVGQDKRLTFWVRPLSHPALIRRVAPSGRTPEGAGWCAAQQWVAHHSQQNILRKFGISDTRFCTAPTWVLCIIPVLRGSSASSLYCSTFECSPLSHISYSPPLSLTKG